MEGLFSLAIQTEDDFLIVDTDLSPLESAGSHFNIFINYK